MFYSLTTMWFLKEKTQRIKVHKDHGLEFNKLWFYVTLRYQKETIQREKVYKVNSFGITNL